MDKEAKNPFVFSWSTKHTRLSFQMFISSLLAAGVSVYGLSSVQLFGIATLEKSPTPQDAFLFPFGFACFSWVGFLLRSLYEAPSLDANIEKASQEYKRINSSLKKFKRKVINIINGKDLQSFKWNQNLTIKPNDEDADAIFNDVRYISNLHDEWYYNLIGGCLNDIDYNVLPERHLAPDIINAQSYKTPSKYEYPFSGIFKKIRLIDNAGIDVVSSSSNRKTNSFRELSVDNLDTTDFNEVKTVIKKQISVSGRLYRNLLIARFLRFFDVWFLAVIVPILFSSLLIIAAAKTYWNL